MSFTIKLVDGSKYSVERADIVDTHLEIEMSTTSKTVEEIETIFKSPDNIARIGLEQPEDEEFGHFDNWTKYVGTFKNENSILVYLMQPVDETESRITAAESASANALQIATKAAGTVESMQSTVSTLDSSVSGLSQSVESVQSTVTQVQSSIETTSQTINNVTPIVSAAYLVARTQAQALSDQDALQAKSLYDTWADLCAKSYKTDVIGFKFTHNEDLYKTAQNEFTFQSQWEPGTIGTESIYTRIDEEHAGTQEDPIPYQKNMELFEGKYYTQNDTMYLCIRDSGIPMQYDLNDLISAGYVQVVE